MKKSKSKSCRVRGFLEALQFAREQVESYAFDEADAPLVETLCRNMATIYQMPKDALVSINSVKMTAEQVAATYRLISRENIEHIITNFNEINYKITRTASYLRTALYNSVFESSAFWQNKVQSDLNRR